MASWFENIRKRYKIARENPQFWDFPDQGFGYIQIPKVATRSIRAGLMGAHGLSSGIEDFTVFEQKYSRHMTQAEIRRTGTGKVVFAFVRHPLARLYSAYADKILNASREGRKNIFECHGISYDMTFDQFVEAVCAIDDRHLDRHLRAQAWFLTESGVLLPTFIGHLENFNADWEHLRTLVPALGTVGHLNLAAGDTDFFAQYSPISLALASRRFASDFEYFGYPKPGGVPE